MVPGRPWAKFAGLFHSSTHGRSRSGGLCVTRRSSPPPQPNALRPTAAATAADAAPMAARDGSWLVPFLSPPRRLWQC